MTLNGKHALVTGGGTGIGLAIAQSLRTEGAQVTICGRRPEPLDEACKGDVGMQPVVMDVADPDSVAAGFAQARAGFGALTICVLNAGIAEGRTIPHTSLEFWRKTMAINLDGAFLTLKEALGDMQNANWGRVIAISSIAGLRGLKGGAAYTASKHGMVGLIRAASEDYMGSGITFNALCPGYVDTPIVERNINILSEKLDMDAETALKQMTRVNRHKRLITPQEVASAATWLCKPGSESVNGQAIEIAGGQM